MPLLLVDFNWCVLAIPVSITTFLSSVSPSGELLKLSVVLEAPKLKLVSQVWVV